MSDYKIIDAETHFSIMTDCPYCDAWLDVTDDMREHLNLHNGLSATHCDQEVDCKKCDRTFIVDNINF